MRIYHITNNEIWIKSEQVGSYIPKEFSKDGFIHCSTKEQVTKVANAKYWGKPGLILLEIVEEKVTANVKYENLDGGSEQFPHIYGELKIEAVARILEFPPNSDGSFSFPED